MIPTVLLPALLAAAPDGVSPDWANPQGEQLRRVTWFNPAAAAGERGGDGNKILALVPRRLFAFTWNAPPSLPAVREKRTVVNVHFEEVAPNRTRVVLTAMGWGAGEDWARAHACFEQAWPKVLAGFAACFTPEGRARVAGGAQ